MYRIQDHPYRDSGEALSKAISRIEEADSRHEKIGVNAVEKLPGDHQADDRKDAHLHPEFLQPECSGFRGEQAESAIAVERRKRDQIEKTKQDIQGKEDAEYRRDALADAALGCGTDDLRE